MKINKVQFSGVSLTRGVSDNVQQPHLTKAAACSGKK